MKDKYKLILHIISISMFFLGIVLIHIAFNSQTRYYGIFNIHNLDYIFILDFGLTLLGIGFFIEFILTFKPIRILDD